MKQLIAALASSILFISASAQNTAEFPKGCVLYVQELHGTITNFTVSPDLFVSNLRLTPQLTVIPGHLRFGATAAGVFNNKKLDGTFGPNLAVNLWSPTVSNLGKALNVQLQGEYLWGTSNQRLIGGLLNIELAKEIIIGLSMHRDYALNDWWFQAGVGYNFLHPRKPKQPEDILDNKH